MNAGKRSYVLIVSTIAALGGLLYGFDTAVISGTTPFIKPYFGLGDIGLGWAVSSLLVGCIFEVILAGKPSDVFGRKKTLMGAAILFMLSAAGSGLSQHFSAFIVFRIVGGLGVGIASMVSPMYISEIAPASRRGYLVSINQLAIVLGVLLAFSSNALLVDSGENNWRWMLGVMGFPGLLFFSFLFIAPESPRWLVQKGFSEKALEIFENVSGPEQAREEVRSVEEALKAEHFGGTYREVFSPRMRPVLVIGILIAVFSQITGINSIMYYAPVIFQSIGSGASSAVLQTVLIGGCNLVFTLLSIRLIDRSGRKPLLIWGAAGMMISLIFIGMAFFMKWFEGFVILFFILAYCASFAVSIGCVGMALISEIFPNQLRSKAMSVAIVMVWLTNFLLILVFPLILSRLGGATVFLLFAFMCLLLLLFTIFRIPETKGKSLEELEKILIERK